MANRLPFCERVSHDSILPAECIAPFGAGLECIPPLGAGLECIAPFGACDVLADRFEAIEQFRLPLAGQDVDSVYPDGEDPGCPEGPVSFSGSRVDLATAVDTSVERDGHPFRRSHGVAGLGNFAVLRGIVNPLASDDVAASPVETFVNHAEHLSAELGDKVERFAVVETDMDRIA